MSLTHNDMSHLSRSTLGFLILLLNGLKQCLLLLRTESCSDLLQLRKLLLNDPLAPLYLL